MLHGVKGWPRMGSLHLEVTYVESRPAWCVILELLFARDSPPIARTAHLVGQAFARREC